MKLNLGAVSVAVLLTSALGAAGAMAATSQPSVLLITIDTLRRDHVSAYGYERPTTSHIDRLMAEGVRFNGARTDEPLTAPALVTMLTSLPPHMHGATRNGLAMREGLPSLPKVLARRGWRTAAFVSNWTLRDELTGLAEHWDLYQEVLTRSRWFGLIKSEATATDVTDAALEWLRVQVKKEPRRPVLLWAHYVEPHAPYELQEDYLDQLGIPSGRVRYSSVDLYDSEIAYCDDEVGRLLRTARKLRPAKQWIVVFTADHGESLGEHDYWGHGRHLYGPGLRIPLSIVWPGHLDAGVSDAPVLLSDLPATVLRLLRFSDEGVLRGHDWSAHLRGDALPEPERVTWYQAHRGAVQPMQDPSRARRDGLLAVARMQGSSKEILRVESGRCRHYDLRQDPKELHPERGACSAEILAYREKVEQGLARSDTLPLPDLSPEDIEKLRALGYLD